jgi:hypothetical protein
VIRKKILQVGQTKQGGFSMWTYMKKILQVGRLGEGQTYNLTNSLWGKLYKLQKLQCHKT